MVSGPVWKLNTKRRNVLSKCSDNANTKKIHILLEFTNDVHIALIFVDHKLLYSCSSSNTYIGIMSTSYITRFPTITLFSLYNRFNQKSLILIITSWQISSYIVSWFSAIFCESLCLKNSTIRCGFNSYSIFYYNEGNK